MAMVRVWNDNKHDFNEEFMDKKIHIPAGRHVMMEEGEAHLFRCNYYPARTDGDGQPDPRYFKMIRLEVGDAMVSNPVQVKATICQACRYEASNEKDLGEHVKSMHSEIMAPRDEEAEKAMGSRTPRAR